MAQSVKWPTSAQVMISWLVGSIPALGSMLTAHSLEPALDSVSPSLSARHSLCSCSLSLSKINKHQKFCKSFYCHEETSGRINTETSKNYAEDIRHISFPLSALGLSANMDLCFWVYWRVLFFFLIFLNVFLFIFETERNRAWAGEGQRERETQNLKQAPGSELSAQSLTRGSNSQTVRSWPEPKSDA